MPAHTFTTYIHIRYLYDEFFLNNFKFFYLRRYASISDRKATVDDFFAVYKKGTGRDVLGRVDWGP